MPVPAKRERITTPNGSDLRQMQIQHNQQIADLAALAFAGSLDTVWAWQTPVTASLQALGRGSTDTQIGTGALKFAVNGMPEAKAAVAAGTAIGAQTVTADQWALYVLDIAAGGAITVTPAAGNVAGYATEALAIAACPARVTAKARLGYITLKTKTATAWVAATDGLAGGSTANFASITNYYPFDGIMAATGAPTTAFNVDGQWNGTRNGVVIPTVLSRGSTDTQVANTAFTFNANGLNNVAKAAVAAGTAPGALGTVPIDTWAVLALFIDAAGTVTYLSGAANYSGGYGSESVALGAGVASIIVPAGKCLMGVVTLKTKSGTTFVVGTDAFAGGASGNVASATNYYPVTGVALATSGVGASGMTSAQIANEKGTVFTSLNY